MSRICHVCLAGDAELRVRAIVGDEPVLALADDLAVGPLVDIDQADPVERIAYWQAVFAPSALEIDWQSALQRSRQQLAQLAQQAESVVIWHGTHASEWLLNLRVHHWLCAGPASVSEVSVGQPGAAPLALAMLDVASLAELAAGRRLIAEAERQARAGEWACWRDEGSGVRDWLDGRLQGRPADCEDTHLLSLASGAARPLLPLIGQAMADTGRTDSFCLWRVSCLLAAGQLRLQQGSLAQWQQAWVQAV